MIIGRWRGWRDNLLLDWFIVPNKILLIRWKKIKERYVQQFASVHHLKFCILWYMLKNFFLENKDWCVWCLCILQAYSRTPFWNCLCCDNFCKILLVEKLAKLSPTQINILMFILVVELWRIYIIEHN